MSRRSDAKSGLKLLYNYADPILDAYLNNNGQVPEEGNEALSKGLLRYDLGFRLEEDEPVHINQALDATLAAVTRNQRISTADHSIAPVWRYLREAAASYKEAKRRNSKDEDYFYDQAYRHAMELISLIRESVNFFSGEVTGGMTYIQDQQARLKRNRELIERAGQLNEVLRTISFEVLYQEAGQDRTLRRILTKAIPRHIERYGRELTFAIEQLNELLHTMTQEQRHSKLVDKIAALYDREPGYEPELPPNHDCPDYLTRSEPLLVATYPDPSNSDHHLAHQRMIDEIGREEPRAQEEHVPEPITSQTDDPAKEVAMDPLDKAVTRTLKAATLKPQSAIRALALLEVPCSRRTWIFMLLAAYHARDSSYKHQVTINHLTEPDPVLTGDSWLLDIELLPREMAES